MERTDHERFGFAASDLLDPIGLASKLCYARDVASERIRSTLDESILRQIEVHLSAGNSEKLNELLVETLNRLLSWPQLYHPAAFADTRLTKLALESQDPSLASTADMLARLNRQILQITYSDEVAPSLQDLEGSIHGSRAFANRSVRIMGNATDTVVVTGDGAGHHRRGRDAFNR